jgi:UDP-N-acetylmuramoylalanine--D-glutamate ligase
LGAAVSGRAAARLARELGNDVTIYDRSAAALEGVAGNAIAGEWQRRYLAGVDLAITSPGFPEHVGAIPDILADGIPLVSEMEYAASQITVPYAAVTGTNGKTTVTSAAADMLTASGVKAIAAGNIGTALSDIALDPPGVVVVEASSFQLRFIDRFHPRAAAILNIAPDHLDWHSSFAEYVAAKQRIFENHTGSDILVYDCDDESATAAVEAAPSSRVPVSGRRLPDEGFGPAGTRLVLSAGSVPRPELDAAYTMDVVAAASIAAHLGATIEGIGRIIGEFQPGKHRRSLVGRWGGVAWINDSKATNPHAAVASVAAFDSVILIAGGRNKGLDLGPIVTAPTVRRVIGIGEAAPELAAATPPTRFHAATTLDEAVAFADSVAERGDTVLLAPGCASFDMFSSYQERGEEFARLVFARKGDPDGK